MWQRFAKGSGWFPTMSAIVDGDPPLVGTHYERPAPELSPEERRAEIEEMRTLIRERIEQRLAPEPSVLLVEPHQQTKDRLSTVVQVLDPPTKTWVLADPDADAAQIAELMDVWLIVVAVDTVRYDAVALVTWLQRRFPHATIVARTGLVAIAPRGRLFDRGIKRFLGADELVIALPAIMADVVIERQTLAQRLERPALVRQIMHRLGPKGLAETDWAPPDGDCQPLAVAERRAVMRGIVAANGSRTRAAGMLHIARSSLYALLDKHHLTGYFKP